MVVVVKGVGWLEGVVVVEVWCWWLWWSEREREQFRYWLTSRYSPPISSLFSATLQLYGSLFAENAQKMQISKEM